MPSALGFIGGGLLQGIGKGLAEQGRETGKAKRERKLAELALERDEKQMEGRRGLLDASNAAAMGRLELEIGSRKDIAGATSTAAGERRTEASRSAETVAKIGASSREKVARIAAGKPTKATDTSAAEKRFWDIAVKASTRPEIDNDGLPTGSDTTDWNAVALDMDARNLSQLAATARRRARNDQARKDRKTALPIAEERVEAMDDSFFGESDAKVFKQYGGSRTKALEAILREEIQKIVDTRNGGEAAETPATEPAAVDDDPYVDAAPPRDHTDAKRAPDGFWYVKRDGKFLRVQNSEENRVSRVGRDPR